jgi:hypothetical protein
MYHHAIGDEPAPKSIFEQQLADANLARKVADRERAERASQAAAAERDLLARATRLQGPIAEVMRHDAKIGITALRETRPDLVVYEKIQPRAYVAPRKRFLESTRGYQYREKNFRDRFWAAEPTPKAIGNEWVVSARYETTWHATNDDLGTPTTYANIYVVLSIDDRGEICISRVQQDTGTSYRPSDCWSHATTSTRLDGPSLATNHEIAPIDAIAAEDPKSSEDSQLVAAWRAQLLSVLGRT